MAESTVDIDESNADRIAKFTARLLTHKEFQNPDNIYLMSAIIGRYLESLMMQQERLFGGKLESSLQ